MAKGHLINNRWTIGAGEPLAARDPATDAVVWEGRAATADEVDQATRAGRSTFESWAALDVSKRIEFLQRFAEQLKSHKPALAERISGETGKPLWESSTEVDSMIGKVPASIEAHERRRNPERRDLAGVAGATRFKPFGVVAVFGPFNFPGHLPNGHIVPALLAGNTVIFKPSEMAPSVAEMTAELWMAAGLPLGVFNMVQGGPATGIALASHAEIDGLFFTGSFAAGQAINRALADQPGKILALEMGGNNPLIVHNISDIDAAAYATIQSAYITSGQRCSCARRLIVPDGSSATPFVDRLIELAGKLRVGPYTDRPEPFMGPVISRRAGQRLLAGQRQLIEQGGKVLREMKPIGDNPAMLSPGLIDVTDANQRDDAEHFGPLLQLIRVPDFNAAIAEANRTRYGLAAGLLSDDASLWEIFYRKIRAGVVNFNRPLTGASAYVPFGGVGASGNNRPSAYYATDYCSYPVASLESPKLTLPATLTPGVTL
jgi:succinylglutamic semialdehyde dehydrogenase